MKKLAVLAVAAVFALTMAGCSCSSQSSSSASSSSLASASDLAASSSSAATVKWTEAKTAEEAAKAAGVEKLGVPKEGTKISLGELGNWKYFSAEKMAEADGGAAAAEIVIRKATGTGDNTQAATTTGGGRDLAGVTYANQWSVNMDGTNVRCYGNEKGKASKAIWDDGKYSYSILVLGQGDNWQDFGIPDDDIAVIVKAIKEAESAKQEEKQEAKQETKQESQTSQGGSPLSEADVEKIIWDNGYGEVVSMLQVQLNDNKWYWEVTTRGSDGTTKDWIIDPDGNINSF